MVPSPSGQLSRALTVANVLGTVLVVAIHYSTRQMPATGPDANYLVQEFISNGLARVAVPFFAFAAGLFLALQRARHMTFAEIIGKRARTILVPYLLVSGLILLFIHGWAAARGRPIPFDIVTVFVQWVLRPQSFQFWFLRDLIVMVALSPLLVHRSVLASRMLAAVLLAAWLADVQPFPVIEGWYLLNIETLCFFCLGAAFANQLHGLERLARAGRGVVVGVTALWLALVAARVAIDPGFSNWYSTNYTLASLILYKLAILTGLASLIALSCGIAERHSGVLRLQSLTFFVFLFHEYPFHYFLGLAVGPVAPGPWGFFLQLPVGLVILAVAGSVIARWWPTLFGLLTGGRGPGRAPGSTLQSAGAAS